MKYEICPNCGILFDLKTVYENKTTKKQIIKCPVCKMKIEIKS